MALESTLKDVVAASVVSRLAASSPGDEPRGVSREPKLSPPAEPSVVSCRESFVAADSKQTSSSSNAVCCSKGEHPITVQDDSRHLSRHWQQVNCSEMADGDSDSEEAEAAAKKHPELHGEGQPGEWRHDPTNLPLSDDPGPPPTERRPRKDPVTRVAAPP
ncbi:uncharacterized protein LOC117641250 [Thrips palmi]|uniref:Uncharacterized protein LOC117641250 n=1 Tax=Thrips palmi TaxID=161013 RepID=A0A6P8YBW3_THRPL|nr:uncharacterized protein LOC117641250 [Thrips palmi]